MTGEQNRDYPDSETTEIEAPEPWEPWETWLCLGSVILGIAGLVILGILVHRFLL